MWGHTVYMFVCKHINEYNMIYNLELMFRKYKKNTDYIQQRVHKE